jgi:hypothetical protein
LGPGVHDVEPDQLARRHVERVLGILGGPAVEDDLVRGQSQQLAPVQRVRAVGAGLGGEIELALDQHELLRPGLRRGRIDDEGAIHAVRNMHRHRRRAAVIHERTRNAGHEAIVDRVSRQDVYVILAGGDFSRVKVHAVRNVGAIEQGEVDRIALAHVKRRPRHAAPEGPGGVRDARGDVQDDVLDLEPNAMEPGALPRRKIGRDGRRRRVGAADRRLAMGDVRRRGAVRRLDPGGCVALRVDGS